jgi:pimeloyl-ACP methyl ester carboxylesterase
MIRRLTLLAAFVAFATPSPAATQSTPAPCLAATAECTELVAVGGGPGRALVYRNYALDKRNDAITNVLVLIHGASRDADNYYRSALAAAFLAGKLESALVIAPRMASGGDSLAQNEISWDNTWRSGGPSPTYPAVTSFDFLDEILRKVARKELFPNLKAIVVTGHSAGGQVTNRYAMSSKVHDSLGVPVSYVVSNPSSYAYPTDERPTSAAWPLTANAPGYILDVAAGAPAFVARGEGGGCSSYDRWAYGFQNRTGYTASLSDDQLKRQLAARPTTYLLGQVDILPLSGFDSSCGAMAQGPTRQARGQAYAKYVNEKLGGKHQVIVVVGCGHNGRCMYTSEPALRVLFPQ